MGEEDGGRVVLIAEGDSGLRRDYVSWLEDLGFVVVAAASGLEALELARAHAPQVAVINGDLPWLDGWQAVRGLRRIPALGSTKIIALVSRMAWSSAAQARLAGSDIVVSLPVRQDVLVSLVCKHAGDPESLIRTKAAQPVGSSRFWFPRRR